jgi:hypothetical protein
MKRKHERIMRKKIEEEGGENVEKVKRQLNMNCLQLQRNCRHDKEIERGK